jgi:hypothetical protein
MMKSRDELCATVGSNWRTSIADVGANSIALGAGAGQARTIGDTTTSKSGTGGWNAISIGMQAMQKSADCFGD